VIFLASCMLALAAFPGQGAAERFHRARYELRGPLESVVFGQPGGSSERGTTRIVAKLRRGELRSVVVPFDGRRTAAPAPLERVAPPARADADPPEGRVLFIEFVDSDSSTGAGTVLPAGLLARARPPVEIPVGALRVMDLAWLLACSGAVLSLRRRPFLALVLGVTGAAGGVALRRMLPPAVPTGVTVIEADLSASSALRVDAGAGSMGLSLDEGALRVTTRPRGAALDWTLDLSQAGRASYSCGVAGSVSVVSRFTGDPELGLASAANDWAPLAQVWTRSAAGEWAFHGRWSTGTALPAPGTAAQDPVAMPPGWLASGLPPGRGVLIARLAPALSAAPGASPLGPGAAVWLRAAGFE
jgi:hypothetical protein